MNATQIVTQTNVDVNAPALTEWEPSRERNFKWHGKSLAELSREDAQRIAQRQQAAATAAAYGVMDDGCMWM